MGTEMIRQCPICQRSLQVTKLTCKHCGIDITGDFAISRWNAMSKDELDFIEAFVKAQGNIKEMERLFKVSYPTIKKMLDGVIQKMGGQANESKAVLVDEDDILEKIRKKEMTVDEAIQHMKGKKQ